jgi:hypothetical protein
MEVRDERREVSPGVAGAVCPRWREGMTAQVHEVAQPRSWLRGLREGVELGLWMLGVATLCFVVVSIALVLHSGYEAGQRDRLRHHCYSRGGQWVESTSEGWCLPRTITAVTVAQ